MFGEWFKDDGSICRLIDLLVEIGIAMEADRAIEWSDWHVSFESDRRRYRNEKAIDDAFMAEIRAAAIKRARARKLSLIAEEENETRLMEAAEAS